MNEIVKKNGVTFGIIMGLLSVTLTTIYYSLGDLTYFVNWRIGLIMLFVNLIIAIVAIAMCKKALGGFISFKDALACFIMVTAIGSAISSFYTFILLNFIEPGAKDIIKEHAIKFTYEMMKNMGAKTGDIKESIQQVKESDSYGAIGVLKGFFQVMLIYIVLGLLTAAAMKKNKESYN